MIETRLHRAPRLFVVSNSLPFAVNKQSGGINFSQSIGGVSTALRAVSRYTSAVWMGTVNISSNELSKQEQNKIKKFADQHKKCFPIFLSTKEHYHYYSGYCNQILWPILHEIEPNYDWNDSWWDYYKKVNLIFCENLLAIAEPNDLFWINDYHLLLLPGLIRKNMPQSSIGFFLHVPFPKSAAFFSIPHYEELCSGIAAADIIGVYTEKYKYNIEAVISNQNRACNESGQIVYKTKSSKCQVKVFHLGVDVNLITNIINETRFSDKLEDIKRRFSAQYIILSADRLDYTKGIINKVRAFEIFFERNTIVKSRVQIIFIVAKSRMLLEKYSKLNDMIRSAVDFINARHGTESWQPTHLINEGIPYDKLIAFYRAANMFIVTSLKDGLNLMAKEYLFTKGEQGGVLILSAQAGASFELTDATIVDPYDIEQIVAAIEAGMREDVSAIIKRNRPMLSGLRERNAAQWASDFVAAIGAAAAQRRAAVEISEE